MDLKRIFFRGNNVSKEAKASVAYTICGILTKCMSFITLPIFTRVLTKEEYGLSTVYSSTMAIMIIFTSLQLPYGSLSTAMIKFKDNRDGYLSSTCGITLVLTLIYLIVCTLARNSLQSLLDIPYALLVLMGIEMFFNTVQMLWMGKERFEYKYKSVVFVTLLSAIATTFLSVIAVYNMTNKGVVKILSNAIIVIIIGAIILLSILKHNTKIFDRCFWHFALSFNIPLIPYYLSQVVFNQSDRLMIDKICGRGDAAVYGVAYSLATILTFVISAIHTSYVPWMFEKIEQKKVDDNRRVSILLSAGIAFMLLGVIALAPEIVYIMAGKEYIDAIWVVPPVAMSVLLLYYSDLFDCIEFYYEAKWFLAIAAILSAIVNIVLNFLFIPIFGFISAAYTTLISYFILALVDYIYMRILCDKNGINKNLYDIKALSILFIVFCGIGFIAMALYNYPMIRYAIIAITFVCIFIFRNKIIQEINKYKK